MEQINCDIVQHNTTRNKHFTMIERPGPSKHLLTLKDCYWCQQRLQILPLDHRENPQETDWTFFEKSF